MLFACEERRCSRSGLKTSTSVPPHLIPPVRNWTMALLPTRWRNKNSPSHRLIVVCVHPSGQAEYQIEIVVTRVQTNASTTVIKRFPGPLSSPIVTNQARNEGQYIIWRNRQQNRRCSYLTLILDDRLDLPTICGFAFFEGLDFRIDVVFLIFVPYTSLILLSERLPIKQETKVNTLFGEIYSKSAVQLSYLACW